MESPIKIPREPVESSNIASIGYDVAKQILAIHFKNGAVFNYAPFTQDQMLAFYTSESKGRYFAQHIKGKIPGTKCTGDCPKCGDKNGWIGETCTDCGCAPYEETRKRDGQHSTEASRSDADGVRQ